MNDDTMAWGDSMTAANGVNIRRRRARGGAAGRPPVLVLIHCFGLDSRMWAPVVSRLPETLDVYAVDVPGHGASIDLPKDPDPSDIANLLHQALSEVHHGSAVVAGISMGGMLAQYLGVEHKKFVAGLVLGDTSAARTEESALALRARAAMLRNTGPAASVGSTIDRWFSKRYLEEHPEEVSWASQALSGGNREQQARTWEMIAALDIESRLPLISAPTHVLVGELDTSTTPAMARRLAGAITGARFSQLPGTGHISALEAPEAWAKYCAEETRTA